MSKHRTLIDSRFLVLLAVALASSAGLVGGAGGQISRLEQPSGTDTLPAEPLVAGDFTQTTVLDFTADEQVDVEVIDVGGGDGDVQLAREPAGQVFIVGEARVNNVPDVKGHLHKFFESGEPGAPSSFANEFFVPRSMTIGSDELIYYPQGTLWGNLQKVTVWNIAGVQQPNFASGAAIRAQMSDTNRTIQIVRADDTAHLYFAPTPAGTAVSRIAQFNLDGTHAQNFVEPDLQQVRDIAVGGAGRVYAAVRYDPGGGWREDIFSWEADGTSLDVFGGDSFDVGQSIGVDPAGDALYVLNPISEGAFTNRVEVFDLSQSPPVHSRTVILQNAFANRLIVRFGKIYGTRENVGVGAAAGYQWSLDGTRTQIYQAPIPSDIPSMFDIDVVQPAEPPFVPAGTLTSVAFSKPVTAPWTTLVFNATVPPGTSLMIDVLDGVTNQLLAADVASGTSLNDLAGVGFCRSTLKLRARFATSDVSVTPILHDWTAAWGDDLPDAGDCNSNGTADACDLDSGTSTDCNSNSVPDECDVAAGTSIDCNSNNTPDECDLESASSADCNSNTVPDECDAAGATSQDANGNLVPDECEDDCNGNGIVDDTDIAGGTSQDCNNNGVPDECDIATGTSQDCNTNGFPDECELLVVQSPADAVHVALFFDNTYVDVFQEARLLRDALANHGHTVTTFVGTSGSAWSAALAGADVLVVPELDGPALLPALDSAARTAIQNFVARGGGYVQAYCTGFEDLDLLNPLFGTGLSTCNSFGGPLPLDSIAAAGTLFEGGPTSLPASNDTNSVQVGQLPAEALAIYSNGTQTTLASWRFGLGRITWLGFDYSEFPTPVDWSDVADRAVRLRGTTGLDCNTNGVLDECDITSGVSVDNLPAGGNGVPDECEDDCNGNGIVDDTDIAGATSQDCNNNGTPDECDVAAGTSSDCDGDDIPDDCGPDCNDNGFPDQCDVASGTSQDCQSNGIPDECEFSTATKIYWTNNGVIQRADPDGSNVETVITGLSQAAAIAVDAVGAKMYWTEFGSFGIRRAKLDGSNVEHFFTTNAALGIALDVAAGKMYWTGRGGAFNLIRRADLDGSNPEIVVVGLDYPYGIALDTNSAKMYWTDEGTRKIQRANLDGADVEDLVTTGLNRPDGIALDLVGRKMYWTDGGRQMIRRANLDGTLVENVVIDGLNLPLDVAVDAAAGKMYWVDFLAGTIQRANLDGSESEVLASASIPAGPRGIALAISTAADCNSNGVLDECDVAHGIVQDCNSNGVPDSCERDCNANSVPDACDIGAGTSIDCNNNDIPDRCDMQSSTNTDCNSNAVLDECDIAFGTSADCNNNGVPDRCDIANGMGDCNSNEIPDLCEIGPFNASSEELAPLCTASRQTVVLRSLPPATGDVTFTFRAIADLNELNEFVTILVGMNECLRWRIFGSESRQCPVDPDVSQIIVPRDAYNLCLADGDLVVHMVPSGGVDCVCSDSFISVSIEYDREGQEEDCNTNGVPDSCDVASGTSADCNMNDVPDECEESCNANNVPDECDISAGSSADCNDNEVPDECDTAVGTSTDLNDNDVPDECEDCNTNGIPDDLDLLGGTSEDCNNNDVPDACDLAQGTGADCNTNGIIDECEIAAGTSPDCNGNGVPDACDLMAAFASSSGPLSPIGSGIPHSHMILSPPPAIGEVTLTFSAVGDLNGASEYIDVNISGVGVGTVFQLGANQCPATPDEDQIVVSAEVFNAAVDGDDAVINMLPSGEVNAFLCSPTSFIAVTVEYEAGGSDDCNTNSIPDECDVAAGTSGDCNSNGVPDECDVTGGTSEDNDGDGSPDECLVPVAIDIKPGSCPNPFNRGSHGVLPVALLGTADFDVSLVEVSSIRLVRADGVGGAVAPHEGPPGPQSTLADTGTPFAGERCDCHELEGDGLTDLSMKFRTDDVVANLRLDLLPSGALVELVVTGNLLDGVAFAGSDCVRLVPPGGGSGHLAVSTRANEDLAVPWIETDPLDVTLDGGGFSGFTRVFFESTVVTLTASPLPSHQFEYWLIDGVAQPAGQERIEIIIPPGTRDVEAVYLPVVEAQPVFGTRGSRRRSTVDH